ncbi:putative O-methyltransferase YrrM [Caulobacter ginsengisoli]|uniref:O-methyltransferase YrrM n=1 Tax=Caulobacter ginsengisoli TaxID=400775 RepID=A0ABU0IPX1_9CAUL|nr:class I SAM-dependent methyltransferase [Caulobacter ginsengisoli]MDQ0464052.1 putative O-methyltransferase YrrM [Caulobacter ginsengisoli]
MNLISLARRALRKPDYALTALSRQVRARPILAPEIRPFVDERLTALREAFSGVSGTTRGHSLGHGAVQSPHAEMLWSLVRSRKPARVVETGVCNGLSSAVMLKAMDANGAGELVSVDLPEFAEPERNTEAFWAGKGGAVVPPGKDCGWLVPDEFRGRWSLVLGRASEVLPAVLADGCDIFIHDSEHSYENQLFEFRQGWAALRPGGVLVATDINWSAAFDDWRKTVRGRVQYLDHSCALVSK